MKVRFVKERTTKNTVVYRELPELDDDDLLTTGSLYILKSALSQFEGLKGSGGPEYLYIDIQAG